MKRGSSTAATTERLVEPTSLTTQSSPATASTAATVSGSSPTGAATKAASAPASASAGDAARDRDGAQRERLVEHALAGIPAAHLRPEASARGHPDRAADEAHADHGHDGPA